MHRNDLQIMEEDRQLRIKKFRWIYYESRVGDFQVRGQN